MVFKSKVKGFIGLCKPTWTNKNKICNRLDGGVSGFFKLVVKIMGVFYFKTGKEFHGIIDYDGIVRGEME